MSLEDLGDDGNCGVDGVGDDKDECLGSRRGDTNGQVMNDASVDLPAVRLSFYLSNAYAYLEEIVSLDHRVLIISTDEDLEAKTHRVI